MAARTPNKPQPVVTTSPLVTNLGGEATALGEHTLATATADSTIVDKGVVTKAKGTITASATAQSEGEDFTYATAYTFAEIDGADHFKTKTKTYHSVSENEGQTIITETSVTKFHAMAKEAGKNATTSKPPKMQDDTDDLVNWYGDPIDGNVAAVQVDAQAHGENSYVGVDAFALVLEDQMSTVGISVITAVDF